MRKHAPSRGGGAELFLSLRRTNVLSNCKLVGVERFELPTSCSQSRRATRLRYTPIICHDAGRQAPFSGGRIILTPCQRQRQNGRSTQFYAASFTTQALVGQYATLPDRSAAPLTQSRNHAYVCTGTGRQSPGGANRSGTAGTGRAAQGQSGGKTPILATILVGDDPASATYVKMKGNACRRVGMESWRLKCPPPPPPRATGQNRRTQCRSGCTRHTAAAPGALADR